MIHSNLLLALISLPLVRQDIQYVLGRQSLAGTVHCSPASASLMQTNGYINCANTITNALGPQTGRGLRPSTFYAVRLRRLEEAASAFHSLTHCDYNVANLTLGEHTVLTTLLLPFSCSMMLPVTL